MVHGSTDLSSLVHAPTGPSSLAGHLNDSQDVSRLEEIPGAPLHKMDPTVVEGHGKIVVNVVDPGAGPPAVGKGRPSEALGDDEEESCQWLKSYECSVKKTDVFENFKEQKKA